MTADPCGGNVKGGQGCSCDPPFGEMPCRVYWGSHGCDLPRGHGGVQHVCANCSVAFTDEDGRAFLCFRYDHGDGPSWSGRLPTVLFGEDHLLSAAPAPAADPTPVLDPYEERDNTLAALWAMDPRPFAVRTDLYVHTRDCSHIAEVLEWPAWYWPKLLSREEASAWLAEKSARRRCSRCSPEVI